MPASIVVAYRLVMRLAAKHEGHEVYLLWRESAQKVGELEEVIGVQAAELVDRQHDAAQEVIAALLDGSSPVRKLHWWLEACRHMVESSYPDVRALGAGLIESYRSERVFFGDVHTGNVGEVTRAGKTSWVITDPGNVVVFGR